MRVFFIVGGRSQWFHASCSDVAFMDSSKDPRRLLTLLRGLHVEVVPVFLLRRKEAVRTFPPKSKAAP